MSIREPVLVKCEDGRYLEVKLRDIFEEKRPVNPTVYCSPKKKKKKKTRESIDQLAAMLHGSYYCLFCNSLALINFFSHLNSEYKTKTLQNVNRLVCVIKW